MNKRTKAGQGRLFSEETGSPLFSKSPMKADESPFLPAEEAQQSGLFGRPQLDDLQPDGRMVHCPYCDSLVSLRFGRLTEHTVDGDALSGPLFGSTDGACQGSGWKLT